MSEVAKGISLRDLTHALTPFVGGGDIGQNA
jgi:hypothetical protein